MNCVSVPSSSFFLGARGSCPLVWERKVDEQTLMSALQSSSRGGGGENYKSRLFLNPRRVRDEQREHLSAKLRSTKWSANFMNNVCAYEVRTRTSTVWTVGTDANSEGSVPRSFWDRESQDSIGYLPSFLCASVTGEGGKYKMYYNNLIGWYENLQHHQKVEKAIMRYYIHQS